MLLVQRGSRFLGFTPEGQRVLDWARRIVGDTRAMREEIQALKRGLAGHLRIAAVPDRAADHGPADDARSAPPTRRSRSPSSRAPRSTCSALLENLEVDAGVTYIDNEPLGRVRAVPLFHERYRLLTGPGGPLGDREEVSWAELGRIPLCLLTPDMQNRRIIDRKLRAAGAEPIATLQSNSMVVLFSHVQTGKWASIMPAVLAETLGLTRTIRSIPIVDPGPRR